MDFEQLLVVVADLEGVPKVPWNVLSTGSHSGSRGGSESSMELPFKDELVRSTNSPTIIKTPKLNCVWTMA